MKATALSGRKNNAGLALGIGVIGIVIAAVGLVRGLVFVDDPYLATRAMMSWLLGFMFWFSLGIGMLMLILITYIFDAGWSIVIRRQLEHAVGAFKWLGVLFLPLLIVAWIPHLVHDAELWSPGILWKWMDPEYKLLGEHPYPIGQDTLYIHKSSYLNMPFFTIRAILYFAIFIGLAELLRHHSFKLDQDGDVRHATFCRKLAAAGIPILALALTFAAFDWLKSLEYHWFSTMYGVWFFASCFWAAQAGVIIILHHASKKGGALHGIVNRTHFYYTASILLAFTVFWAYISFSQYFLIYNANIPEETFWYNLREFNVLPDAEIAKNVWWWVSLILVFGHFFVPFLFLLFYKAKFGKLIYFASFYVLLLHLVDLYWNIVPGQIPADNPVGYITRPVWNSFWDFLFDLATLVGIGGICVFSYLRSRTKAKAIPIRDPRIVESIGAAE